MGLLTRTLLRNARRLCRFLFGSHSQESSRPTTTCERTKIWAETVLTCFSVVFDLLDWINTGLDFTLVIRLLTRDDGDNTVYAIILLIGLILGRIVEFRSSYLFSSNINSYDKTTGAAAADGAGGGGAGGGGGIRWTPFWISPRYVRSSKKYHHVFPLLYCLVFTEMAVFLWEDYPSLSIYAHWTVINFPPYPLETFDNVNVAFSAIMLGILLSMFIIAILSSLIRLSWYSWTAREKCCNACKICIFLVLVVFLLIYIFDALSRAIDVAIRDIKLLPSNTIMGIQICDPIENFQDRDEFCDEESFVVHVAFAWLVAFYFSLYIFFRPLRLEDLDDDDDYSIDHSNGNTTQSIMAAAAAATMGGAAAVTGTTLTSSQFFAPSNNHNQDITFDATIMTATSETNNASSVVDDPENACPEMDIMQSPAQMGATIVAAATGSTPQQQATASDEDDPLPLIVTSSTTATSQQH